MIKPRKNELRTANGMPPRLQRPGRAEPRLEPDNTPCERKARVFKQRQCAAMALRSFESLGSVCDDIATVDNMRVAGKDVFAESGAIFNRSRGTAAASA